MKDPYENYPQHRPMPHPGTQPDKHVDTTPLCPWCNEPMESTGMFREIEFEVCFTLLEEVYECRNCDYDDEDTFDASK